MGQVSLNGEIVEFDGPSPQTCGEACKLIDGFLSGQGLSIGEIKVDGAALSLEEALDRGAYQTLAFTSVSPQVQLLAMCRTWKDGAAELVAKMDELSVAVLRCSWSESHQSVVALLDAVRPVVEGIGVLQRFGAESEAAWGGEVNVSFERALEGIDRVVGSVEARDCVALSDGLAGDLAASWRQVIRCLDEAVIPCLEKEFAT